MKATRPSRAFTLLIATLTCLSFNAIMQTPRTYAIDDMIYGNGPVMQSSNDYAIFWLPRGYHFEPNGSDANYENLVLDYFNDVGGTSFYNTLTQYSSSNGNKVANGPISSDSSLAGVAFDADPYKHVSGKIAKGDESDPIRDIDVQNEISQVVRRNPSWSVSPNSEFFVFTGFNLQICINANIINNECTYTNFILRSNFCGYHLSLGPSSNPVIYAVIPDDLPSCKKINSPSSSQIEQFTTVVLSHEQSESVTDPVPFSAWSDSDFGEIGDVCEPYTAPEYLHFTSYEVQAEWSNADSSCAYDYGSISPNVATGGNLQLKVLCNALQASVLPTCGPTSPACPKHSCTLSLNTVGTNISCTSSTCTGTLAGSLGSTGFRSTAVTNVQMQPAAPCSASCAAGGWAQLTGNATYGKSTASFTLTATDNSTSHIDTMWLTVTPSSGSSQTYRWACQACLRVISAAPPPPTPRPAITSVSPTTGPTSGGTSVTITGTNFTGATGVTFGSTPASSFTVDSPTQITAVSPACSTATAVDVTVATPAGTSATSSADQFTFTPNTQGSWTVFSAPPGLTGLSLTGLGAISASDIWAVGSQWTSTANVERTLIEHWDGSSWSVIPSPNVGTGNNFLAAVAGTSSSNAWAVGDSCAFPESPCGTLDERALIEHWDGSSWSVVSGATNAGETTMLSGIAAISASDVWLVGTDTPAPYNSHPLAEHWDGTQWQVIDSPNGPGYCGLNGITALSASDMWAVGECDGDIDGTLTEHWDGTSWNVVASPNTTTSGVNQLNGVSGSSSNDVWAVGMGAGPLTEHWDGSSWSVVPDPVTSTGNPIQPVAVVSLSPSDVWTVSAGTEVMQHWDGEQWQEVASPFTDSLSLQTITAISGDIWITSVNGRIARYSPSG